MAHVLELLGRSLKISMNNMLEDIVEKVYNMYKEVGISAEK